MYGYGIQVKLLPSNAPYFHGHEPVPCGSASSVILGSTSINENPSAAVLDASTNLSSFFAPAPFAPPPPPPRFNIRPTLDATPGAASRLGVTPLRASAPRGAHATTAAAHAAAAAHTAVTSPRRRPRPPPRRRPSFFIAVILPTRIESNGSNRMDVQHEKRIHHTHSKMR